MVLSRFVGSCLRLLFALATLTAWGFTVWAFLATPSARPRETLPRPADGAPIWGFSSDGRALVTADCDAEGHFRLWDTGTREELVVLKGHEAYVLGLAFSPDGRSAATISYDGTARVWDMATGRQLLMRREWQNTTKNYPSYPIVAFAPDGRSVVTAFNGDTDKVARWDVADGRELASLQVPGARPLAVRFDEEGRAKVVFVGGLVEFVGTPAEVRDVEVRDLESGNREQVVSVPNNLWAMSAVSPDGRTLATGHRGGTVRLWDLTSGVERSSHQVGCDATALTFSSDGRHLAVRYYRRSDVSQRVGGWNRKLGGWLWNNLPRDAGNVVLDTASGECRRAVAFSDHTAFTPDGKTLLTIGPDTLHTWDVPPRLPPVSPSAFVFLALAIALTSQWWFTRRAAPRGAPTPGPNSNPQANK